jgi:hypothetical protein
MFFNSIIEKTASFIRYDINHIFVTFFCKPCCLYIYSEGTELQSNCCLYICIPMCALKGQGHLMDNFFEVLKI